MPSSRRIPVSELKIGMYVSSLDRPWIETPFLLQGFAIETNDDIAKISEYCDYVSIDIALSRVSPAVSFKSLKPSSSKIIQKTIYSKARIQEICVGRKLVYYEDTIGWQEEFPKARAALNNLSVHVKDFLSSDEKKVSVDMVKIKAAVEPMIDSIIRNPDACIWLARMKVEDDYTYQHSLGCSIWAVAFGRQLGLQRVDLRSLAIGGLLFDIGKLQLDKALLKNQRRLSDEEFEIIKQHVALGIQSLDDNGVINQDILSMTAYHHERHNGMGYPNGLSGDAIPVFARIAAIVDCYDAITSDRYYAKAINPCRAVKQLYDCRDIDFQAELVEEFIQAIGIYPAGTLVKLTTGEVAIVVAEYRSRRLRPHVMVLLDAQKKPVSDITFINLMMETHTVDNEPIEIVDSVEPATYGIDMTAIQL